LNIYLYTCILELTRCAFEEKMKKVVH